MNLHKKKYTFRFTKLSMLVLSVILITWTLLFYNVSKKIVEETFFKLAKATAVNLSNTIEQSPEDYKKLLDTHDTETDFYKSTFELFSNIIDQSDIKYAYTVERVDEEYIRYIIDVPTSTGEDVLLTPIGTVWDAGEYAIEAFDTKSVVVSGFEYYPIWNETYMCAYAPIIDPNTNEMLGLVGVDIQVDELMEQLNQLKYSALLAMSIILLIVYVVLSRFTDKLVKLFVMDGLTNVYNRKFFDEHLKYLFDKSKKKSEPLSMLIIDIDHFKKINDNYGHPFGDIVLKKLCKTIAKNIKKEDCFARYGGEEFVLLLYDVEEYSAIKIAKGLKDIIEDLKIHNYKIKEDIKITISIGVACTKNMNSDGYNELVEMSDKALYQAKVTRNTVCGYSSVEYPIECSK